VLARVADATPGFHLHASACALPRSDGSTDIGLLFRARHSRITPVAIIRQTGQKRTVVYFSTRQRVDRLRARGTDFVEHRARASRTVPRTLRLHWNGRRYTVGTA
jgi:hypothetical protein